MFMEWKNYRLRLPSSQKPHFYRLVCIFSFFLLLFSAFVLLMSPVTVSTRTTPCLGIRCRMTSENDFYIQKFETFKEKMKGDENLSLKGKREVYSPSLAMRARRFLSGLGSSPPRCMSKCGRCMPCKPVHVPVPPGTPVTAEYYPEAWRCKCGNKLYMP